MASAETPAFGVGPVGTGAAPLPVAGWYVDPEDDFRRRWWDGAEWTDHTRSVVAPPIRSMQPAESPLDTRSSIRALVREIEERGEPAARGRHARADLAAAVPGPRRGVDDPPAIAWFELPERNPLATAALVLGLVSLVVNPALLTSAAAVVLGGIGLARSGRTFRGAGRARATWAVALGVAGAAIWGAATAYLLLHPELLSPFGIAF